jgi:hypothetical protein
LYASIAFIVIGSTVVDPLITTLPLSAASKAPEKAKAIRAMSEKIFLRKNIELILLNFKIYSMEN